MCGLGLGSHIGHRRAFSAIPPGWGRVGNRLPVVSLRSTTGYGLRPLRGGGVARIPRILRSLATHSIGRLPRTHSPRNAVWQAAKQSFEEMRSPAELGTEEKSLQRRNLLGYRSFLTGRFSDSTRAMIFEAGT